MSPVAFLSAILLMIPCYLAVWWGGWMTLFLPVFSFMLVPLIDQLSRGSTANPSEEEEERRLADRRFDLIVAMVVPGQLGLLLLFLSQVGGGALTGPSLVGATFTVGIACASFGINVGHELGHRRERRWQLAAQALLFTSLYMHFFIEHNRGHHRRVATWDDPASSRRGESIYAFLPRSMIGGWRHAWRLEGERLAHEGRSWLSWHNQMLRFQVIQAVALVAVGLTFGVVAAAAWVVAGLLGALLLETINYVEHYGLRRERNANGVYERVQPRHSWNSNRPAGRALLFDLTRHADHHAHATRPYAVLRHHDDAPELPAGYPAMILLSFVPPLFMAVMDRLLDAPAQGTGGRAVRAEA